MFNWIRRRKHLAFLKEHPELLAYGLEQYRLQGKGFVSLFLKANQITKLQYVLDYRGWGGWPDPDMPKQLESYNPAQEILLVICDETGVYLIRWH